MTVKRGECVSCGEHKRIYGARRLCWICDKATPKTPCLCGCGALVKGEFVSGHNTRLLPPEEQGRRGRQNVDTEYQKRGAKPSSYIKKNGRHLHRAVMEEKLGRPLEPGEIVHHIDHDKHNNHPDNLAVMTQSEHCKVHSFGNQ